MGKTVNLRGFEKEILVSKIVEEPTLYPRTWVNNIIVYTYLEAMKTGNQFPPLIVDQKNRLIDGLKRLSAYRKLGVEKVNCIVKHVRDDAQFFELAVAANKAHGEPYSAYDRARVVAKAEELGIDKDRIASMLSIRLDSVEEIEKRFASANDIDNGHGFGPVPLKASVRHLAGRRLTNRQRNAHEHIGGMQQTFYVNQVLLLLEGNLLDYKNPALMSRLYSLQQALEKVNFSKFQLAS
jgi:hypothetical protein